MMLCAALTGCEREERAPTATEPPAATTAPAEPSAVIATESQFLRDLRRRAEGGDVPSMLTLADAYQTTGGAKGRAEARKWYEKARAAGSTRAKEALALLEASETLGDSPATAPVVPPVSDQGAPTGLATPTTSPTSTQPATSRANLDPTKVSWKEIQASYDLTDFDSQINPDYKGSFYAISAARDETMIVAAMGPNPDEMRNVQIFMRVRSRQDPAEALRVKHASAIAATVTRDNVSQQEMVTWVKNYLATEEKSEPIYRNGWQITFTGPVAEGKTDRKNFLGNAVKIEMVR
jgi:hypothetical protein